MKNQLMKMMIVLLHILSIQIVVNLVILIVQKLLLFQQRIMYLESLI